MDKIKTGMKLLIFLWIYYIVSGNFKYKYIRTPVTRTLKGNEKLSEWAAGVNCTEILIKGEEIKFELAGPTNSSFPSSCLISTCRLYWIYFNFFWGGGRGRISSGGSLRTCPCAKVLGMISASLNARLCVHRSASGFALNFLGCFCFLVSSKAEMFFTVIANTLVVD